MNVQFAHTYIHTPARVREIITEARKVAAEASDDPDVQAHVFREACRLLGATTSAGMVEQPPPMLLPHMGTPQGY